MLPRRDQEDRREDLMPNPTELLHRHLDECPLVAIIRGVLPHEAEEIGQACFDAGIRIIEVPLNSPQPFDSIRALTARFGDRALGGGGTVLEPGQVRDVQSAGGRLIVSPNTNVEVISEAAEAGLVSCPGYFTPSDAFDALDAGATALKLFPAEAASPAVLKAQRAVLPPAVRVLIVGGVTPDSLQPWLEAGANGFGLGGGLYRPGQSPEETGEKARAYVRGLSR
jgi:2-dehydro-3-deoxyphosphogalactonate aldolase